MKIFLSWSGAQSRYVAESLRDWLPNVIQQVSPWLSAEDISPGMRWSSTLAQELMDARLGIICLTRDNLSTPWILFEAGALSKAVDHSRVIPLLYDLDYADVPSPLSQFQAAKTSRDDMFSLLKVINSICDAPIDKERLKTGFEVWWPRLAERLSDIPAEKPRQLRQPTSVELVLGEEFEQFDAAKETAFLSALRTFLRAKYEIRIVGKSQGSTRITVELEFSDAIRLIEAHIEGVIPIPAVLSISIQSSRGAEKSLAARSGDFDVFLCHNSADKPAVRELAEQLRERGVSVWLDEEQLRPGVPWQVVLEQQIGSIRSAAVCIGEGGLGPWQQLEMRAFLSELLRRDCPVIPVILRTAAEVVPDLPIFLRQVTWVDLRREDPNPYDQLVYGITGERRA